MTFQTEIDKNFCDTCQIWTNELTNMEKDLGITFDKQLEFDYHIQEKTKKANSMYGMLRRTFKHLDEKTFVPLYKTMARSQLDYSCVIWNPYKE